MPKKSGPPKRPPNQQQNFQSLSMSNVPVYTLEDFTHLAAGSNRASDFVRNNPPPLNASLQEREAYWMAVLNNFLGRGGAGMKKKIITSKTR